MTESRHLPAHTRRLFAHYEGPDRLADTAPTFVIGRILEEGNCNDLRWLFERFSEADLLAWLTDRASRQLSRRSRLFWQLVFARELPDPPPMNEMLWPL